MAKDERPRQASHPALKRLEALVGEWEIQVFVGGQPIGRGGAKATFEWMQGEKFLVQHARTESTEGMPAEWVENSPMPLTTIIGLDDAREEFTQLYADARGVFRVYQMSLHDGVWKLWRDAPGFSQRFTGTFSDDGNVITGAWELSTDGTNWEHDFDLTYTRTQ